MPENHSFEDDSTKPNNHSVNSSNTKQPNNSQSRLGGTDNQADDDKDTIVKALTYLDDIDAIPESGDDKTQSEKTGVGDLNATNKSVDINPNSLESNREDAEVEYSNRRPSGAGTSVRTQEVSNDRTRPGSRQGSVGSHNKPPGGLSGISINIGGEKYVFADRKNSSKSSQGSNSLHLTYASNERRKSPTKSKHLDATAGPYRVQYLPNGRPVPDLSRVRLQKPARPTRNGPPPRRVKKKNTPRAKYETSYPDSGLLLAPFAMAYGDMKKSNVAEDFCQVFGVFFALGVRVVMGVFCILTVALVVDKRNDQRFWALCSILSLLVVETIWTIYTRRGQERKWVAWCFVCYLLACVPSVWLLELQRLGLFESEYSLTTSTNTSSLSIPGGLTTTLTLDSDDLIFVMENCLVFLLILCRWLLPRGEITRNQLSQLLFVFIGMGSDVMELFQLFDAEKVKKNRTLSYIILAVWTLSLFQFCLVLTMSASPQKSRALHVDEANEMDQQDNTGLKAIKAKKRKRKSFRDFFLTTEIWSLLTSIIMLDGPYLAVRLYVVIELNIIDSTIIFFVCKNAFVVLLICYRFIVIGLLMKEDQEGGSDDEMDIFLNGSKAKWADQSIPTISGRSDAVSNVTTLTSVSSTSKRKRQKGVAPASTGEGQ